MGLLSNILAAFWVLALLVVPAVFIYNIGKRNNKHPLNKGKKLLPTISGLLAICVVLIVVAGGIAGLISSENLRTAQGSNEQNKIDTLSSPDHIATNDQTSSSTDNNFTSSQTNTIKQNLPSISSIVLTSENPPPDENAVEVHVIDVGQGDSILIKSGELAMLIDAGETKSGEIVTNYLKNIGVSKLEYLIGTHPHEDHIGGLSSIIQTFGVKTIIMPKVVSTTKTFDELLDLIKEKGLKVTSPIVGQEYTLDKATFEILAPAKKYKDINDNSVVIRLSHGENDFLFTGDIGKKTEKDILNETKDLDAEVLKVAHHGSKSSTSSNFLKTVNPKYAAICVGENNQYGHPDPETIKRIESVGASTYRTDLNGSIVFKSDGSNITVTTTKQPTESSNGAPQNKILPQANNGSGSTPGETCYIGNKNSKKLHRPTCYTLPLKQNQINIKSIEEAKKLGYKPCKNCFKGGW